MPEIDQRGINQLLLGPLNLLNRILGTAVPGIVFVLLLAVKRPASLRDLWLAAPLGYKTKVALFFIAAYVVGSALLCPIQVLHSLMKKPTEELTGWIKDQPAEIRRMLSHAIIKGPVLATPGLLDHLSEMQAEANYYLGTGSALVTASLVSGDRYWRWLELAIGLMMLRVGGERKKLHTDEATGAIGVGMANVIGTMTDRQISLLKAVFEGLKTSPTVVTEVGVPPAQSAYDVKPTS